jgi:hypothetical protein
VDVVFNAQALLETSCDKAALRNPSRYRATSKPSIAVSRPSPSISSEQAAVPARGRIGSHAALCIGVVDLRSTSTNSYGVSGKVVLTVFSALAPAFASRAACENAGAIAIIARKVARNCDKQRDRLAMLIAPSSGVDGDSLVQRCKHATLNLPPTSGL